MSAKLRIKTKGIEIEWEGEVEYLKKDLPELITSIVAALGDLAPVEPDPLPAERAGIPSDFQTKFTTASLAAKLRPANGPELFKVALAKLQMSDNVEPAPRAQIHREMKSASKFYKPAMANNLNNSIDTLLKAGSINEPSKGHFSLSHDVQEQYLAKLK